MGADERGGGVRMSQVELKKCLRCMSLSLKMYTPHITNTLYFHVILL